MEKEEQKRIMEIMEKQKKKKEEEKLHQLEAEMLEKLNDFIVREQIGIELGDIKERILTREEFKNNFEDDSQLIQNNTFKTKSKTNDVVNANWKIIEHNDFTSGQTMEKMMRYLTKFPRKAYINGSTQPTGTPFPLFTLNEQQGVNESHILVLFQAVSNNTREHRKLQNQVLLNTVNRSILKECLKKISKEVPVVVNETYAENQAKIDEEIAKININIEREEARVGRNASLLGFIIVLYGLSFYYHKAVNIPWYNYFFMVTLNFIMSYFNLGIDWKGWIMVILAVVSFFAPYISDAWQKLFLFLYRNIYKPFFIALSTNGPRFIQGVVNILMTTESIEEGERNDYIKALTKLAGYLGSKHIDDLKSLRRQLLETPDAYGKRELILGNKLNITKKKGGSLRSTRRKSKWYKRKIGGNNMQLMRNILPKLVVILNFIKIVFLDGTADANVIISNLSIYLTNNIKVPREVYLKIVNGIKP